MNLITCRAGLIQRGMFFSFIKLRDMGRTGSVILVYIGKGLGYPRFPTMVVLASFSVSWNYAGPMLGVGLGRVWEGRQGSKNEAWGRVWAAHASQRYFFFGFLSFLRWCWAYVGCCRRLGWVCEGPRGSGNEAWGRVWGAHASQPCLCWPLFGFWLVVWNMWIFETIGNDDQLGRIVSGWMKPPTRLCWSFLATTWDRGDKENELHGANVRGWPTQGFWPDQLFFRMQWCS